MTPLRGNYSQPVTDLSPGRFAWWLSYPVHFYTGSYGRLGAEETTGRMESVNPIRFLAAGLIISAILGAITGFVAARRGWRLTRHGA
ncbi:hypothetical protein [Rhodococcus koreensis]